MSRHVVRAFSVVNPTGGGWRQGPEVLALEPEAYLVKPFPLYALERALQEALASPKHESAAAL